MINASHYLEILGSKDQAVQMLKRAFSTNKDTMLQARYLSMLADVDFEAATQMQMSLAQPDLTEGHASLGGRVLEKSV